MKFKLHFHVNFLKSKHCTLVGKIPDFGAKSSIQDIIKGGGGGGGPSHD